MFTLMRLGIVWIHENVLLRRCFYDTDIVGLCVIIKSEELVALRI